MPGSPCWPPVLPGRIVADALRGSVSGRARCAAGSAPQVDFRPLAVLLISPSEGPVPEDPMRSKILIVLSFAAGAAIASLVVLFAMMRWSQHQSQMCWVGFALDHTRYAMKLSRGEHEQVLLGLEKGFPGLVQSVHSFGDNDQTRLVFRAVNDFYEETGKPVPPEITGILPSRHR